MVVIPCITSTILSSQNALVNYLPSIILLDALVPFSGNALHNYLPSTMARNKRLKTMVQVLDENSATGSQFGLSSHWEDNVQASKGNQSRRQEQEQDEEDDEDDEDEEDEEDEDEEDEDEEEEEVTMIPSPPPTVKKCKRSAKDKRKELSIGEFQCTYLIIQSEQ
jgi:TATA-binding protein-associated factor Taf7